MRERLRVLRTMISFDAGFCRSHRQSNPGNSDAAGSMV
jgi:hypothetical protein